MSWKEKVHAALNVISDAIAEAPDFRFFPCGIPYCGRPVVARGMCKKHYQGWYKSQCQQHGVKKLKDIPEVPTEDPNQQKLFPEGDV